MTTIVKPDEGHLVDGGTGVWGKAFGQCCLS